MKKIIFVIILMLCFTINLLAQSHPVEKKMEKVYALLDKNKIEKAEESLEDLLNEYSTYGKAWDLLAKIKKHHYEQSKSLPDLFGGNVSVTTTDEDGNEIKGDSLSSNLMALLNNINPSTNSHNQWVTTLRKATFSSNTAYHCSIILRNELRVVDVDTLVNEKALKYYNKGEVEFVNKNYNKAAEFYQRALEYQPDFYKANLYLADSYFFMKNYTQAIEKFRICADKFPELLEPRKYLVDAYTKEGLVNKALDEAIESMLIYPDMSMAAKYEDLVYSSGSRLQVSWIPRLLEPNKIERNTERFELVKEEEVKKIGDWEYYKAAQSEIEIYCDDNGIVSESNKLTSAKYLEVHSWEKMLAKSDVESFKDAKMIKEKGFLDCYVLITCFHDDFYDQYLHFVKNNREKIYDYFELIKVAR